MEPPIPDPSPDDGLNSGPVPIERLNSLRIELNRRALEGFVIPHADEYQSEYLPR